MHEVVSSSPIVMHIFQILLYQHKLVHTSMYWSIHDYITYFFANVQTIIFHYFIFSKKTITSLMTLLLFHLFFSLYIIAIIAIMTLLFALFVSQTIITIILFEKYYIDYLFSLILF